MPESLKKRFDALDPKQQEAVSLFLSSAPLVAVTGPAGTGKTTIMRTAYEAVLEHGGVPVMYAPTGKAARRIQESTGIPAYTIHKGLRFPMPDELDEKTGKPLNPTIPQHNKKFPLCVPETDANPVSYTHVFVDEYAMVNSVLHRQLLDALPRGCKLRVLGDMNQLPPIEEKGNKDESSPFKSILSKPSFPSVTLETIHRQGEGSGIIENGKRILNRAFPKRYEGEFDFAYTSMCVKSLLDYVKSSNIDFKSVNNQIITPGRKNKHGCNALSHLVRSIYIDSDAPFTVVERSKWDKNLPVELSVGDKIIWRKNDYNIQVMNGEVGIVVNFDEHNVITVDFGDRIVDIPPIVEFPTGDDQYATYNPQHNLDLAYVVTTHQCQGSEYDHVLYMVHSSHYVLLNKHNFYTAITRAKKSVYVVCDQLGMRNSLREQIKL